MHIKIIFLNFVLVFSFNDLSAQKVVRKGVTPIDVTKKAAKADYSLSDLNGKWQEIQRIPADSQLAVAFTDTLLLEFKKDKVEMKDATSMRMSVEGKAQIEAPNTLIAAGDMYTIKSLNKNNLVIDDGDFARTLQKKERFYFETVGNARVTRDSFPHPINVTVNDVTGKWLVYARHAEPGSIKENALLIKSFNVANAATDGSATGEVAFYTAYTTETASCKFIFREGTMDIVADKNTWSFHTYKAANNEFVFGDTSTLLYYAKHF